MFTRLVWLAHNRRMLTNAPPDYLVVPESDGGLELDEPAPFMPDLGASWLRALSQDVVCEQIVSAVGERVIDLRSTLIKALGGAGADHDGRCSGPRGGSPGYGNPAYRH